MSNHENPCAFCTIPEIQERIIIREELVLVFPSNMPIVPGHVLICPTRCVAKLNGLTDKEWLAIKRMAEKMKDPLISAFAAEGFNFAWNEGKMAGQSVEHLHLHMLPRKEGDAGVYEYDPRKFLYRPGEREPSPEEELNEVAKMIQQYL